MSTPTNHWKLGLFVVAGVALGLGTVVYLGASSLGGPHVSYVTYFDESVQGLEVGSPVKFRGVTVGSVEDIDVAPDHRHVAVTSALSSGDLSDLGLSDGDRDHARVIVPPELRVQLVSQGITGLKFLQLDFFPPQQYPPLELSFPLPERHLPAAVSTLKSVESAVETTSRRIPLVLDGLTRVTEQATLMMDQLAQEKLPAGIARTVAHLDGLASHIDTALTDLDLAGLSAQAHDLFARMKPAVAHAGALLARLDGDGGLVASAQRATDAFGDIAAVSPDIGEELSATLRDVRAAAAAVQRVAEALERAPDMLLKGRGRVK